MPGISADHCGTIARSLEFLRAEHAAPATSLADARWKLSSLSKTDGLEVAVLQSSSAEFTTVRGCLHMKGMKPQQVLRLIHDCPNRTAWDEMLQEGSFVQEYGAVRTSVLPECSADIIRLIYKGLMGVSGRDLCLLRAWGEDEDGSCWLVAESCPGVLPVDERYVRAELRECGYMMTPTAEGCEISYISQCNFNGWIPSFMQGVLQKQQPESLRKMNDVLKQRLARAAGGS